MLDAVRACFAYPPGENRATGYLYGEGDWPEPLRDLGPALRAEHGGDVVVFQAYRDGTATCPPHSDAMDQAIVSLGATRTFQRGDELLSVAHGDVTFVPAGVPHAILPDPTVTGERVSLVFRTR